MTTFEVTRQVSGAPALSPTDVNLSLINPKRGAKFSPNLYAFLTASRQKSFAPRARVFLTVDRTMWLGYFIDLDQFVGVRMSQVLCYGTKVQLTSPVNLGPMAEVVEFWPQYLQDGRCAIDRTHKECFINDDSRWTIHGDSRSCQWCGKARQRLVRREEVVVRESWVNA